MAKLTIITGPDRGRVIELEMTDRSIVIGRKNSDIVLRNAAVSRNHAQISLTDGVFEITDCGSANGTFVNDQKIHETVELGNEDQIRCGSTVLLFESRDHIRKKSSPRQQAGAGGGETMVGLTFGELISKGSAKQRQKAAQAGLRALNISHGIKNLFQTVASGREVVDYALALGDVDRAKRGWKILNRSLDAINTLMLDLLKFSQAQELRLSQYPLNELIAHVVKSVRPGAGKKNITIELCLDDAIGEIQMDPDKMGEAILNLLLNAVEAIDTAGGTIEVTSRLDAEAGQAIITISDDGPGIADGEAVFEPFFSTGKKAHAGLGLPITKKIIAQHAGTVEVENNRPKGAKFAVKLPCP